jgi:hypothetical protein
LHATELLRRVLDNKINEISGETAREITYYLCALSKLCSVIKSRGIKCEEEKMYQESELTAVERDGY